MNTISLELNDSQIYLLESLYSDNFIEPLPNQYLKRQIKIEGCVISIYKTNKVVFQGKDAKEIASLFMKDEIKDDEAGSDEVGTGDFFGPICVCATIVNKENRQFIIDLGVKDSKKITDETIKRIAPKLMEKIPYSLLILDNLKYNEINKTHNLNAIKTKLHNQAFLNLDKKYILPKNVYLDQFCEATKYFEYLNNTEIVFRNIIFETKAEDKYLSVGCGSIIARYAFLMKIEEMSKKYQFKFLKGASIEVEKCAKDFINKFGKDKLKEVAKLNFKTIDKINN